MTQKLQQLIKTGILMSAIMLINVVTFGATFTAVASGSWSNTLTWGGTVPAAMNIGDQVNIPAGINVQMDNNITLNGLTAQLNIDGTLSATPGNVFGVMTGTINGAGTIDADSIAFGTGTALIFAGTLTANTLSNAAFTLQTSATVIVNKGLTLAAGTFSVQTGGTLTFAANSTIVISGGQLAVNGGTLGLTANYNVIYNTGAVTAGLELSGANLQNLTINVGALNSLTLINNLNVAGIFSLTSGTLILATHNLTLAGNIAATGTGKISSTIASNVSITSSNHIAGKLTFSGIASGVNNLAIQIGAADTAAIAGRLNVGGTLTLTGGTLNLSSVYLALTGDIAANNSGSIASSVTSSIGINTSTSPAGDLKFTAGSAVDSLLVNIGGGGSAVLSSNLTVTGTLNLTSGFLNIGNNMLTMSALATITGANSNAYIITGVTGSLAMPVTVAGLVATTYPIGTAAAYLPATVLLNAGSTAGTVDIGVSAGVLSNGTTGSNIATSQHVVDATWFVHSNIVAALSLNLQVMWATASELNGFERATSHIAHYTGGSWDASAALSATAVTGGMFSLTRTNLTSLSPFAVFDQTTATAVNNVSAHPEIELYPSPASDNISFNHLDVSAGVINMDIMDVSGKIVGSYILSDNNKTIPVSELPAGNYFVKLYSNNMTAVKQFTKI